MYIKINGTKIEDADWRVNGETGELRYPTDNGITDIQELFNPENEVIIEEYNDDDTLKARWYMRNIVSVAYKANEDTNVWEVQIKFSMSATPISEVEDIRSGMEDTDDGLIEIAGIADDLGRKQEGMDESFTSMQTELSRLSSLYNNLADRVAALENERNEGGN